MQFNEFKAKAFLPTQCQWMNERFLVGETEVVLMAFVERDEKNEVWYMVRQPKGFEGEEALSEGVDTPSKGVDTPSEGDYFATKRAMFLQEIKNHENDQNIFIKKMVWDGLVYESKTWQGSGICLNQIEQVMMLQYCLEKGLDLTGWEEVFLSDVMLYQLEVEAANDVTNEKSHVVVDQQFKRILLDSPLRFESSLNEEKVLSYIHPLTGESMDIFIQGISSYDLWATWQVPFESEWARDIPAETLAQMKEEHEKRLEHLCPKGHTLALLTYESVEDVQLDVYAGKELDEPFLSSNQEGTSGMMFLFSPDEKIGPHGLKNHAVRVGEMAPDEKGPFEIEVLAVYHKIPEHVHYFKRS